MVRDFSFQIFRVNMVILDRQADMVRSYSVQKLRLNMVISDRQEGLALRL